MSAILSSIDACLCALVVIAALEYVRRLRPFEAPLLSAAFYLVAIGGFGSFADAVLGHYVSAYTVILHAGVVTYAWVQRLHVLVDSQVHR